LFQYEIKKPICEDCGIGNYYNNKPLTLQLHHINGDNKDNNIKNLQILCPNCHSQTQTFRSKKKITEQDIINACENAISISEVVRKLNRYPSGHLYKMIEKVINSNCIPIKKYNYLHNTQNADSKSTVFREKKIIEPILIKCQYCNTEFKKKGSKKFCSLSCNNKSQLKYDIDEEKAINLIRDVGWTEAAKQCGIHTKCPGNNLKLIIKRYIKNNNLDIDIYKISAFSQRNRYKK
jgi:Zn finger protein HypA/HybF involved in hydrogenase expression